MTVYHILPPDGRHRRTWWIIQDCPADAPQVGGYLVDVAASEERALERVAELESEIKQETQ